MAKVMISEGYAYKTLKPLVRHCLEKGVSVFVKGHPGCGKSTMGHELASEMALPLIDLRLSQMEASEFAGMQLPNTTTGKLDWYKPYWFPEGTAFILLDEINAAVTRLHQAVAYQLVFEKRVGPHKLPEGTVVMAAGNLEEDNALAVPLSSALNNRFAHFTLTPDVDGWLEWAGAQDIPDDIRAYIAWKGISGLYNNTGDAAFPTPRSIAIAARINGISDSAKKKRLITACIGEADATTMMTFIKLYMNINIKDIIDKGLMPDLSDKAERSFVYALVYSAVSYISSLSAAKLVGDRTENAVRLATMLGPDYQMLYFKNLSSKKSVFDAFRTSPQFPKIADRLSQIIETG